MALLRACSKGKSGVLQSMGSQRIGPNLATEHKQDAEIILSLQVAVTCQLRLRPIKVPFQRKERSVPLKSQMGEIFTFEKFRSPSGRKKKGKWMAERQRAVPWRQFRKHLLLASHDPGA